MLSLKLDDNLSGNNALYILYHSVYLDAVHNLTISHVSTPGDPPSGEANGVLHRAALKTRREFIA